MVFARKQNKQQQKNKTLLITWFTAKNISQSEQEVVDGGVKQLVWVIPVIWLGHKWSRFQRIERASGIHQKTRILKWNSRSNMPPTLFHKLFNKRNVFTPPPKCDKDESAFRYVWIFTLAVFDRRPYLPQRLKPQLSQWIHRDTGSLGHRLKVPSVWKLLIIIYYWGFSAPPQQRDNEIPASQPAFCCTR